MTFKRFVLILISVLALVAASCSETELTTSATTTAGDAADAGDDDTSEDVAEGDVDEDPADTSDKLEVDPDDEAQVKEQVAEIEQSLELDLTDDEEACFTRGIFGDTDLAIAFVSDTDFDDLSADQVRSVMGLLFDCVNNETLGAAIATGFADESGGTEVTPELSCAGSELAALGPDALADLAILGVTDDMSAVDLGSISAALDVLVDCEVDLTSLAADLGGAIPGAEPEQLNCFVAELFRNEELVQLMVQDPDSDEGALGTIEVMFECGLDRALAEQTAAAAGLDADCFAEFVAQRGPDLFRELAEADATGAEPSPETVDAFLTCASAGAGAISSAGEYGDDPVLDAYQDACTAGDAEACDSLYLESPVGSEYERYGATCGDRFPEPVPGFCTSEDF